MASSSERLQLSDRLQDAVSGQLPGDMEAYFFGPLLIMHFGGMCHGVLGNANAALAWQRGLDAAGKKYFHLEDLEGNVVTVEDNPRSPGHAYALMQNLEAKP